MKTRRLACYLILFLFPVIIWAQKRTFRSLFDSGGNFSLGVRSTLSTLVTEVLMKPGSGAEDTFVYNSVIV